MMTGENDMSKNLIGVKYKTRGKHPRLCTVVDKLETYNSKGELVKTRYVSEHTFLGQTVTDRDVLDITILRGEIE
jgi:hypothetical protein